MTERITLAAPAKINLSLRILGRRPDGYHDLETLMVPLHLADEVEMVHGHGHHIQFLCNDPSLPSGPENLCVRAAEAFREACGLGHGVSISLMKRIPHGAGLGGGSSDAAAVLRGFNVLFDEPLVAEELHQIAAEIGSDVPFFLQDGAAWCRGRGEILEPVENLPKRRILLVKPPFGVSTPWAYKQYAGGEWSDAPGSEQRLEQIALVNDLEAPVFEKYLLLPVLREWLIAQQGVEAAFMSGSGSTMVAILSPTLSEESVVLIKERIAAEFGPAMWICDTGF